LLWLQVICCLLIIFINSRCHTNNLMVINRNSKGISYDAMMKSKNLNSFFDEEKEEDREEVNAEEE
jgi:hypothetical protein